MTTTEADVCVGTGVPRVRRYEGNPIVVPGGYAWRRAVTFNPGAVEHEGRVYLFERASGSLRPFTCQVGLLVSDDGFHFDHVRDEPVFGLEDIGWSEGAIEDPRVVKIDWLASTASSPKSSV